MTQSNRQFSLRNTRPACLIWFHFEILWTLFEGTCHVWHQRSWISEAASDSCLKCTFERRGAFLLVEVTILKVDHTIQQ